MDAAGAVDAGDESLDVAAVDDVDDIDGLDGADDVDDLVALDAAGVVCADELWALAKVNGPSARIAMARNGTVDFIRTLSLFRLSSDPSGTLSGPPHRSKCASIRVLLWRGYSAGLTGVNNYSTAKFESETTTRGLVPCDVPRRGR